MFLKKLAPLFILLIAYNANAQNNLDSGLDLSNLSQTFIFSDFETSMASYTELPSSETAVNFMTVEYANSAILANNLNTTLGFKKSRNGMEKTGRILTYIGVPLAILGGIMVAGADELYYNCVNGDCEGDARGGFGIVALAAGIGLGGTGGVLWIIGSKK